MDLDFSGTDYLKIREAIEQQIFSPQQIGTNVLLGTSSSASKPLDTKITTEEKTVEILLDTRENLLFDIVVESSYYGNGINFGPQYVTISDKYDNHHHINNKNWIKISILSQEGKIHILGNQLEKEDKNDQ